MVALSPDPVRKRGDHKGRPYSRHCWRPFNETDHIHGLVIPGRHRKVANPESIALGRRLWIPGSRAKARAQNDTHMIRISKSLH